MACLGASDLAAPRPRAGYTPRHTLRPPGPLRLSLVHSGGGNPPVRPLGAQSQLSSGSLGPPPSPLSSGMRQRRPSLALSSSPSSSSSPLSSSPLCTPPLPSSSSSPTPSTSQRRHLRPHSLSPAAACPPALEAQSSDQSTSSTTNSSSTSTRTRTRTSSTASTATSTSSTTIRGSEDEDGGGSLPESRFWEWRKNIVVHYTVAGPVHDRSRPAVLLLPGFGVGTFHWEHQLRESEGGLAGAHRVWAIDFLGQGQSWPSLNPTPSSLSPSSPSEAADAAVRSAVQVAASLEGIKADYTSPSTDTHPHSHSHSHSPSSSPSLPHSHSPSDSLAAAAISGAAQAAKALEEGRDPREEVWGFGAEAHEWAQDLVFSVDTWKLQVEEFISEVIGEPVFVVGNSLGGYVGTYVAAERPDLVRGVALLNATPFWAFSPHPQKQPLLARLWPWGGMLPAPRIVRSFVSVWWDTLRSPATIRFLLQLVYARKGAVDEALVKRIVGPTAHPAAASAFASIVFAPKALNTFDENLKRVKALGLDVCLLYGREDPWVVPLWGYRLKRALPSAIYYELSPCGHCPHHEAPQVVNALLRGWLAYASSTTPVAPPLVTGWGEGQDGAGAPEAAPASLLGELQSTEWHVLDEQGAFEPVGGAKGRGSPGLEYGEEVVGAEKGEEATRLKDGVDHVRVRLIHSPPSSPISFVQAAIETVMATVSGPK